MFDNNSLALLNDQLRETLLRNKANKHRRNTNAFANVPVSSMSEWLDDAISAPDIHPSTSPSGLAGRPVKTDNEDPFAALDIENLFPDDFGPDNGTSSEFKLPKLSADDEDVSSLFPDPRIAFKNDFLQPQEFTRGSQDDVFLGQPKTFGLETNVQGAQQMRKATRQRQKPRPTHVRFVQHGGQLHAIPTSHDGSSSGQMNVLQMPNGSIIPAIPAEQERRNVTGAGSSSRKPDVFKVPKIPERRIKRRQSTARNTARPIPSPVGTPTQPAQHTSHPSFNSGLLPTPPLLQSPADNFQNAKACEEIRSLDMLLGLNSDDTTEQLSSHPARMQQATPASTQDGQQTSFIPPRYSPLDGTSSGLPNVAHMGAQTMQNPNMIPAVPLHVRKEQIRRELELMLAPQEPPSRPQAPHTSSPQVQHTPGRLDTYGSVRNHIQNDPYRRPPVHANKPPLDPNIMRHRAKKRTRPPLYNGGQKYRKNATGSKTRVIQAPKLPKPPRAPSAPRTANGSKAAAFGAELRQAARQQAGQQRREVGQKAERGGEEHKMRKKKRTRVEDLDPSDVHVCSFEDCRKKFAKKYNLKIHERRHRGDLPFICRQCAKKFMWLSSFERHLKVHESRAEGSVKKGGREKRRQKSATVAGKGYFVVVRGPGNTMELTLNGIRRALDAGEISSLALAMALCTASGIHHAEVYNAFGGADTTPAPEGSGDGLQVQPQDMMENVQPAEPEVVEEGGEALEQDEIHEDNSIHE